MARVTRPMLLLLCSAALLVVAAACDRFQQSSPVPTNPSPTASDAGVTDTSATGRPTPTLGPVVPTAAPTATVIPDSVSVSGKPVSGRALRGGTLIASMDDAESTVDAFSTWEQLKGVSFATMQPLHNMLMQSRTWGTADDFQRNSFLELHPDLAVRWETADDGLSVTFTLREDVLWTDGTAFTCGDIAWTYNSIRTGRGLIRSPRAVYLSIVDDVTCADDLTAVFNLRQPKAAIIDAIALPHNIIRPRHVYADATTEMRETLPTVTMGPFVVSEHLPGESITYKRNDTYWDQPFPYLDGLKLVALPESAVAVGLRTGAVDVGNPVGYSSEEAETLERECTSCQFWPRTLAMQHTHHLLLNHSREPWNRPELKEAIALAIDNTKYIRNVYAGWHVSPIGCGFYPSSEWAPPMDRCTDIPGYGDFSTKSSAAADKARAKEILADLGFSPGELNISILFSEETQPGLTATISDIQEIGINAAASALDDRDFLALIASGDFDAAVHSNWAIAIDPDLLLYAHFYTGGRDNFNQFSSVEVDALIDEMSIVRDRDTRKQLAVDALILALEQQAKIIISHRVLVPSYSSRVRGLMPGLDFQTKRGPHLRYDHTWLSR